MLADIAWPSQETLRTDLLAAWDSGVGTCRYAMDVEGNTSLGAMANLVFHLRNPELVALWALPDLITKA